MGVVTNGNSKCACQSKIRKLEGADSIDEQVLRLQVPVEHSVLVAVCDSADQLVEVGLDQRRVQGPLAGNRIHEALEVLVQVLEDKVELAVAVYHIIEPIRFA